VPEATVATVADDDPGRDLGPVVARAVRRAVAARAGADDPDGVRIVSVRRLSGGASRLSWMVGTDPGPAVVVQRERGGSAGANLPMEEQAGLLRAAHAAGVPVPEVLASGRDGEAGFVVLSVVEGESVPRRVLRSDELAPAREGLARRAGEVLARVHRVARPGHRSFRPVDPLEQMRALADGLGEPHPAFEIGWRWLAEHRPSPRPDVLVHGDFRLGNLIVDRRGLVAVLDWELAHGGSPVEDLGWFCCRAWRFGSPQRAGGVGTVEELLEGYEQGGGDPPDEDELRWWEAYGTLRWGLICVLQASVHLGGHHRSVELAAIGRRAAECEEDLLQLVDGPSDEEPPEAGAGPGPAGPHDRPTAAELLDAVGEHLDATRRAGEGADAFGLRVAGNVVATVAREARLAPELDRRRAARLAALGVADEAELAAAVRDGTLSGPHLHRAVRQMVRDKLAVSRPGYWHGDG